ncbi:MAG: FHA domain-containing protein [Roseburia sp.]|nr:FHA domain-containing protein [Roseburia sp.]MCM1278909.1 FHA domain-containing protein [Robinsoniella sp.]
MAVVQCENKHYYDNVKFAQCPHCAKMAEGEVQRQMMIESQRAGTYASEYIRKNMLRQQAAEKITPEKDVLNGVQPGEKQSSAMQSKEKQSGAMQSKEKQSGAVQSKEMQSGAMQSKKMQSDAMRHKESGIKKNNIRDNAIKENGIKGSGSTDYGREAVLYAAGWLVCTGGQDYGRDFPLYAGFNRIGRTSENDIVLTDEHLSKGEHCSVIYEEKKNVFYVVPRAGSLVYANDVLVEEAKEIEEGTVIMAGETELELVVFCKGEKRWEKSRKGR